MRSGICRALFLGSIFTLPWVGVGTIYSLTGVDVGGGLQPSWVLLALAILIRGWDVVGAFNLSQLKAGYQKLPSSMVFITSGTFLAVMLSAIGLYLAPSPETLAHMWGRWVRQWVQLFIMFSFFWWVALWIRGNRRWQLTLDFLFLGAAFQILYSMVQGINFFLPLDWFAQLELFFTSNPSILSGSEKLYLNNVLHEIPRLRGTVCEPLFFGNYLLMVWPFLLVWRRPLWLRLVLSVLFMVILVLGWSRGAWLGFVGQIFLMGVLFLYSKSRSSAEGPGKNQSGKLKHLAWVIGVLALLLPVGNILSNGFVLDRLMATFNNQDWSNLTRLYSMKAAWLAFLQSPAVGIGWGQFAFHFPLLVDPMGLQSQFTWPVVNNFPLEILSETGLIGFAVFTGSGLFLVRKALFKMKSNPGMVLPSLIGVLGVWIQLLSFSQYNLPHIWVGLGLLVASLVDDDQGNNNSS